MPRSMVFHPVASWLGLLFAVCFPLAVESVDSSLPPLSERDDVPWEDLQQRLVSIMVDEEANLITASNQDWFDQCWPEILKPTHERSNHNLINQPSGVCVNSVVAAFENLDPYPGSTWAECQNVSVATVLFGCLWPSQYRMNPNNTEGIDIYAFMLNMTVEDFTNFVLPPVAEIEALLDPSTNPSYDIPHRILFPKAAGDIVAAVEFATSHSIELSVKNSGHHYAGASTKKDTLLLNMREFRTYSPTGIVDCGSSSNDGDEATCAYTNARNVPGYIRVGGGESWSDVYSSVKSYNEERGADGYRFHATGGAAATVAPMGWTWQGGLAGTTNGRMYGFGVDQVVGIEAVLPNGQHVRFGPTEWEDREDLLYPHVTAVSGYCNRNPFETDESNWIWEACPPGDDQQPVNFDDLWFAFLGGGGGTYGIVTSVSLQLQEYPGPMTRYGVNTVGFANHCSRGIPQEYLDLNFEYHLWDFLLDFLHNPSAVGVSEADSNSCGGSNDGGLICYGDSASAAFEAAWENFVLDLMSRGTSEMEPLSPCRQPTRLDYLDGNVRIPDGLENAGMVQEFPGPDWFAANNGYNVLIPREWMMSNKDRAIEMIVSNIGGPPYLAFGGNAAIAHDTSVTSLSRGHREAGMMLFMPPDAMWEYLNEMYDLSDPNDIPPYIGTNHYHTYIFGPLKNDTTAPCNVLEWTREQVDEHCVPVQTILYGNENLARLESIKNDIDPNYLLNCSTCVGSNNAGRGTENEEPVEGTPPESSGSHSVVLSSLTGGAASLFFLLQVLLPVAATMS